MEPCYRGEIVVTGTDRINYYKCLFSFVHSKLNFNATLATDLEQLLISMNSLTVFNP